MVTVGQGRYILPDNYYFSKNQHVYVDPDNKRIGIDQIGFEFLKNPKELKFLVTDNIKAGEPFAVITTEAGISTLNAPCSGEIASINETALESMKTDPYDKGYLLQMKSIDNLIPALISGGDIQSWAEEEARAAIGMSYSFKIIEIGDSAVGKTAMKVRFTDNYYKKDLKTTLGVDFGSKELKCEYMSSDILFTGTYRFTAKMNVWDAAGQAYYDKIRGMYYKDANGCVLVYDVNNPESFKNLDKWINELEENIGTKVPTLLVGNKADLERKVSREEAVAYAIKHGFTFLECSAKTGEGIDDAFTKLAIEMYRREEKDL